MMSLEEIVDEVNQYPNAPLLVLTGGEPSLFIDEAFVGELRVKTGKVLRRGIEVKHLINVGMIDLAMDQPFDLCKVAHHAVTVELLSPAIHINLPVVAMKVLAFALVVEIELMAS